MQITKTNKLIIPAFIAITIVVAVVIGILSYFYTTKNSSLDKNASGIRHTTSLGYLPQIQYRVGPGYGVDDNLPDSFKDFVLNNNMPVILKELYKDLDEESIRNLKSALHSILHLPDVNYLKYYTEFDHEAFDKDFRTKEEQRLYDDIQFDVAEQLRKNYKLPKDAMVLPYVFFYKHNLRFANDKIKEYVKNKIFIDAGSYYGDSALVMMEFNPSIVYSFDISDKNIKDYKITMELNNIPKDKYALYKMGISDKKAKYNIVNSSENPFEGIYYQTDEKKGSKIKTIDIDTFLADKKGSVGFIKADVQGSMYDALVGMKMTIKKHRPVLLFEISDSPKEFFYTKPLLDEITKNLNYTIKITKYPAPRTIHGTDIWAYPKELGEQN